MEQSTNLGCLTTIFQRSAFNAADPYVYFRAAKRDSSLAFQNISVMDFTQTTGEKALLQQSNW